MLGVVDDPEDGEGTEKAKKSHNTMLCMQNATINARSVHLQGERNASGGVGKSEKSGVVERRMGGGKEGGKAGVRSRRNRGRRVGLR